MNLNIINVSLNDKYNNLSYPIFIGNNLLSNCEEFLKTYVSKRKIIIIHDNFFSLSNQNNRQFTSFVEIIKEWTVSVNLIGIPGGDVSKNISQLDELETEIIKNQVDIELLEQFNVSGKASVEGRGYNTKDLSMLLSCGNVTGQLSVLCFLLYLFMGGAAKYYGTPKVLLLNGIFFFYWIITHFSITREFTKKVIHNYTNKIIITY